MRTQVTRRRRRQATTEGGSQTHEILQQRVTDSVAFDMPIDSSHLPPSIAVQPCFNAQIPAVSSLAQ